MSSRGKTSEHDPWQKGQHKAMDAEKRVLKRGKNTSRLDRWQNDKAYRTSQVAIGWTETYVNYLDTSPRLASATLHLSDSEYDITTLFI